MLRLLDFSFLCSCFFHKHRISVCCILYILLDTNETVTMTIADRSSTFWFSAREEQRTAALIKIQSWHITSICTLLWEVKAMLLLITGLECNCVSVDRAYPEQGPEGDVLWVAY